MDRINRDHVETFLADQLARWRPKTAQIRYGALRQFFKWCLEEGEVTVSPMANDEAAVRARGPRARRRATTTSRSCSRRARGRRSSERRDTAILRLFIDCGLRLAEVAT